MKRRRLIPWRMFSGNAGSGRHVYRGIRQRIQRGADTGLSAAGTCRTRSFAVRNVDVSTETPPDFSSSKSSSSSAERATVSIQSYRSTAKTPNADQPDGGSFMHASAAIASIPIQLHIAIGVPCRVPSRWSSPSRNRMRHRRLRGLEARKVARPLPYVVRGQGRQHCDGASVPAVVSHSRWLRKRCREVLHGTDHRAVCTCRYCR